MERTPLNVEFGTQQISECSTLATAVDYPEDLWMDNVRDNEGEIARYLITDREARDRVEYDDPPKDGERSAGYGLPSRRLTVTKLPKILSGEHS